MSLGIVDHLKGVKTMHLQHTNLGRYIRNMIHPYFFNTQIAVQTAMKIHYS